jgi:O-antigen/teichoic acid export membrane protein
MARNADPKPPSIARRMAKGSAWSVATRLTERSLGLLSTLILARILLPQDYGLVAMATGVAAIIEAIGAFGFEWALIQRQKDSREHLDTAWTLNLILAMVKALALLAAATLAVGFYGDPRVGPVLWALAGATAFGGLRNIGMVRCELEMNFQPVFALTISRKVASLVVALSVALMYGGYWALVCGIVASSVTDVAMSYLWQPYRPRWCLMLWRELFAFSRWMLLNNMLNAFNARASDLILGRTLGSSEVGTYSIAKELANLPSTELAAPLMRSFFPAYAKLGNDRPRLVVEFKRAFAMITLLFLPAAVGVSCVAEPMVHVLLGSNWAAAIPVIRVLALAGAIQVMQSNIWPVYMAIGKPKFIFFWGLTTTMLFTPSFWLATSKGGMMYGAYLALAMSSILGCVNFAILSRVLGLRAFDLLRRLARPAIASSAMAAALSVASAALPVATGVAGHTTALATLVSLGAVSYCSAVLILWLLAGRPASIESDIFQLAKEALLSLRTRT